MADEKKPKIDLKTRLQKMGGAASSPAVIPNASPSGVPIPAPSRSAPPPPAIPPPVGLASMPPAALDPNNPLAAVVKQSFSAAPPPAAAHVRAEPQRIEVDEAAVDAARAQTRKKMIAIGGVFCIVTAFVGGAMGNAMAKGSSRDQAKMHAKQLQSDVNSAKDRLSQLADKLEAGRNTLLKDKKFPDTLAQDLAKINIAFSGENLSGKRFDTMGAQTATNLLTFATNVSSVNEKKKVVQGKLSRLQKPITDELAAAANGTVSYQYIAVIDRDRASEGLYIGALNPPFVPTKDKPNLPDKLTFSNPRSGQGNVELPHYTGGDIKEKAPVAIQINPASWERACPSAEKGQIAQLVALLVTLKDEIRHDKSMAQASDNVIEEPKPDLIELAGKLSEDLGKAAQ